MPEAKDSLPPGIQVIVRDRLNANHVVFEDDRQTAMVDSGYGARRGHRA